MPDHATPDSAARPDDPALHDGRRSFIKQAPGLLGLGMAPPPLGQAARPADGALNAKTARSQIIGGSIFGSGAAVTEAPARDQHFARYVNFDWGDYHMPLHTDIPDMTVKFINEHASHINATGANGNDEIPTFGVGRRSQRDVPHHRQARA